MKTNLITRHGYETLVKEINHLWKEERPEVTKIVSWAASLGDRSENADYLYNKRRLREIDRRLRYLRKTVEEIKVIDVLPKDTHKVFFGAWVTLENLHNEQMEFRIVGTEEIYHHPKYISIDSPMARACLQKTVDDEISVKTPEGLKQWYILKVEYKLGNEFETSTN